MLPYDAIFYVTFVVITLILTLYFTLIVRLKPSTETKLPNYMKKVTGKTQLKKKRKDSKPIEPAEPTELATEPAAEPATELTTEHPAEPTEPATEPITEPTTERRTVERECSHYLGHLATLPKGTPFPEECFGCRKVIQCLRIAPTKAIDSFYLAATETK